MNIMDIYADDRVLIQADPATRITGTVRYTIDDQDIVGVYLGHGRPVEYHADQILKVIGLQ